MHIYRGGDKDGLEDTCRDDQLVIISGGERGLGGSSCNDLSPGVRQSGTKEVSGKLNNCACGRTKL